MTTQVGDEVVECLNAQRALWRKDCVPAGRSAKPRQVVSFVPCVSNEGVRFLGVCVQVRQYMPSILRSWVRVKEGA